MKTSGLTQEKIQSIVRDNTILKRYVKQVSAVWFPGLRPFRREKKRKC